MRGNFPFVQEGIHLFFVLLIVMIFVRAIISWLPIGMENPIVRFVTNLTAPLLDPVTKRIPRIAIGQLDMTMAVGFVFVWWALTRLDGFIAVSIPNW